MTPIQLHTVCMWHNLNGFIYCRDANCRKIIKKKKKKKKKERFNTKQIRIGRSNSQDK